MESSISEELQPELIINLSCTEMTEDDKDIWRIEVIDHNDNIWNKKVISTTVPDRKEIAKSFFLNRSDFMLAVSESPSNNLEENSHSSTVN